jgi:hypothetical protein
MLIKPDNIRFRPIGAYTETNYHNVYQKYSYALNAIIAATPLQHYMLTHTTHLKQIISKFNAEASARNYIISKHTFDIENCFMEISKPTALERTHFTLNLYQNTHHTSYLSIPQQHNSPLKPIHGWTDLPTYYVFNIHSILDIVSFSLATSIFILGAHSLHQTLGQPMGNSLSSPLTNIYLAYDEHHSTISTLTNTFPYIHLIIRYTDDINSFIASASKHEHKHSSFAHHLQHNTYDLKDKNINLIETMKDKYLDANIIIYNNKRNIKITHHNKNHDFITTRIQNTSRFFSYFAPVPMTSKLNPAVCIFVKIFDFTTYLPDMLLPFCILTSELISLNYPLHTLLGILNRARRLRPSNIWATFAISLKQTSTSPSPFNLSKVF